VIYKAWHKLQAPILVTADSEYLAIARAAHLFRALAYQDIRVEVIPSQEEA
jgi:hypothetical protein